MTSPSETPSSFAIARSCSSSSPSAMTVVRTIFAIMALIMSRTCDGSAPNVSGGELGVHGLRPEAVAGVGGEVFELELEHLGERRERGRPHLVDRDRAVELRRDRRERRVLEPAGRDPLRERGRVEVDVEGVAVRRDPFDDVDADARDLPRRRERAKRRSTLRSSALVVQALQAFGPVLPRGRGSSASRPGRTCGGRRSGSRRAAPGRGRWTCRRDRSRRARPSRRPGCAAPTPPCAGPW